MPSSTSKTGTLDKLDAQVEEVIAGYREFIQEFEQNQLPAYDKARERLAALTGTGRSPVPAPAARGRGRAQTPSQTRTRATRQASNGRQTRKDQALQIVAQHPGITIPEIAKMLNIKDNYLYRVMPNLRKAGQIQAHANGKGWEIVPGAVDGLAPNPARVAELEAAANGGK